MTKKVSIGNVVIGGGNPIAIQSMTTVKSERIDEVITQIKALEDAGCEIVRCAVKDMKDALAMKKIVSKSRAPIVADVHFDYKLAVAALENGAAKVRVNPGNLGDISNFDTVVDCAALHNASIRIGVNSGSVNKEDFAITGGKVKAMLEGIRRYTDRAEKRGFHGIVLAAKSSSVRETVEMGRALHNEFDYPLHIGVTEAGVYGQGLVKSAIGIGSLLIDGIGDTIRVSLTDDPVKEVYAAKEILKALRLYGNCVEVVSCPTCGRCAVDLIGTANAVSKHVENIRIPLKIAVMGCVVNGPGEASDADFGFAGGESCAMLFKKGQVFKKIQGNVTEQFIKELDAFIAEKQAELQFDGK